MKLFKAIIDLMLQENVSPLRFVWLRMIHVTLQGSAKVQSSSKSFMSLSFMMSCNKPIKECTYINLLTCNNLSERMFNFILVQCILSLTMRLSHWVILAV